MPIRPTHTTNSATGERYATHRLVQSSRVGGRVRQVNLPNFGRQFTLPQAEWPARCARLEELLSGQGALLAGVAPVEREAQRRFARLLARQGVAPPIGDPEGGDMQAIDVDSLELSRPRRVGGEVCRAAPGLGAERPTTGADRRGGGWAHGRAGLGTGDPPLAG